MKKKKIPKQRNYVALAAWNRSGAGPHQDRRYKKKYRSPLDEELLEIDLEQESFEDLPSEDTDEE